ncbi:MAG TPA: tRNA lysidine(34) synthetase TilS [Chloroflexi bacterium]|jgi:tRNA(Ile)-lysidine synthetase-like protein|nr:tRNA lysidine(34) synthetase TilS [Chloroflexota bacterium]
MALERAVRETIERHSLLPVGETVILGVSGGADSLAMLHLLSRLAPAYDVTLHVGHLNHRLRGAEAEADAAFVAAMCAEWGIPYTVESADVAAVAGERGLAIEETARQVRYAFLARLARALGARTVAVAHNADDQVETVLMHLLRGAGLAGLRGMRPLSRLEELRLGDPASHDVAEGSIRLIRPLLEVPRAAIEAYCRAHGLEPRYDLSNLDRTYYRNRLRYELVPYLETYNPNVRQVIQRMAEALAGDYELLRQQLLEVWPHVVRHASDEAITFDLAALRDLSIGLQRSVLREAVHRLRRSLRNINWVHIDDAVRVLNDGSTGAAATLPRGLLLTIDYDVATLAPAGYTPPRANVPRITRRIALPASGTIPLEGGWALTIERLPREALPADWRTNPDPYVAYLDAARCAGPLELRPRREGDWFIPLGLGHRQRVRELMINAKVPRDVRDTLPLLLCGADIAWVVGLRIDERFAVTAGTTTVLVVRVVEGMPPAANRAGDVRMEDD